MNEDRAALYAYRRWERHDRRVRRISTAITWTLLAILVVLVWGLALVGVFALFGG